MLTPVGQLYRLYKDQQGIVFSALGALLGCSVYFLLPSDIMVLYAGALFLLVGGVGFIFYRLLFYIGAGALLFMSVSHFHTISRVENTIHQSFTEGRYWITGRVWEIIPSDKRVRIVLKDVDLYSSEARFDQVQLSMYRSQWIEDLAIGDGVAAQAYLKRPHAPDFDGDYDGRLTSFFQNSDAFGYLMGGFYATHLPEFRTGFFKWWHHFLYTVEKGRFHISKQLSDRGEGVVAALLVGKRGYISDETWASFRQSGLAHLLAISGMHLSFMAGLVFFFSRWLLCCVPSIALTVNIKKHAAMISWLFSAFYMLIAGSTLPTVRAFILLSFVFWAVILCRQKHLLRSLSLAVIIVLLLWPWSVLTASFQLSFVVAIGLTLWFYIYEWRERERFRPIGVFRYVHMVFLSSFMATLLAVPLTAIHFSNVSLIGIFANMGAIPLTAFFIMPLAFFVLVFAPFPSLAEFFIQPMAWGVNALVWWADFCGRIPLSNIDVLPVMGGCLALGSGAVIYFMYLEKFRFACFSFVAMLVLLLGQKSLYQTADFYILDEGRAVLHKIDDRLYETLLPMDKISSQQRKLLDRFKQKKFIDLAVERKSCLGHSACMISYNSDILLVTNDVLSLEDCYLADYVISSISQLSQICREKTINSKKSAEIFWQSRGAVKLYEYSLPSGRPWTL